MDLIDNFVNSDRFGQNLKPNQFTAFLTVAEHSSFTKAAVRLGLSQSALSQRIKQIETAFGTELFDRRHRQVVLTSHGKALLPLAFNVVSTNKDAISGMHRWKNAGTAPISVMGSPAVMPLVTCGLLLMLRQEFGNNDVYVFEALSSVTRQKVLDGAAVLGVSAEIDLHPQLRYTPVLAAQLGLLASPLSRLPQIIDSLDALADVPMVRCSNEAVNTRLLRAHCPNFNGYFNGSIMVDGVQSTIELIRREHMVTVATGVGASHANAKGLVFVPLPGLLPSVHVYIVSRRDAVFDTRQERLRDVLRQSIHDVPWHDTVRRVGVCPLHQLERFTTD